MRKVGIVMGSDSDLPVMKDAAKILERFGIEIEIDVVSAHRTPDRAIAYARTAKERGLSVIIAGAGGAAHLPGVLAAFTALPVIGIPVKTEALGGVDSLYSIVQMPSGIPVATVAINGALNAGILAAEIIGSADDEVYNAVVKYKHELSASVDKKSKRLAELGYEKYTRE